jgi:hypothetical protein
MFGGKLPIKQEMTASRARYSAWRDHLLVSPMVNTSGHDRLPYMFLLMLQPVLHPHP